MAAENPEKLEITDSYLVGMLDAMHAELHEAVRLLTKLDRVLEQYRPLLDRAGTPLAAMMAARKDRRNGGG